MQTRQRRQVEAAGADGMNLHSLYGSHDTAPADKLLPRLDGVRQTGDRRWIALCRAHNDRRPSLTIRETDDGTLLIKCWAGCGAADVVAAAGLELRDLFPRRYERSPLRRRERWVPADVLRCVSREALVVLCAAEALRRGPLSAEDTERLALAAQRLRDAAAEVSHG